MMTIQRLSVQKRMRVIVLNEENSHPLLHTQSFYSHHDLNREAFKDYLYLSSLTELPLLKYVDFAQFVCGYT